MRILLVTPAEPGDRHVDGNPHRSFAQLAMPTVAAATPPGHEITLLDEKVESVERADDADIVGITLHTTIAPHAYRLAEDFRRKGSLVVLGGPHVTAMPEEALGHADAVVVGDAEDTWPRILEDLPRGRSRGVYRSEFPPLDEMRPARLDLLRREAYPTLAITHATRGCPYRCEFCNVPGVSGKLYRHRPVEQVIREVERLEGPLVIFWDDNLTSDRRYAMELFAALAPLKRRWIGQATTVFARDRELTRAAGRSGCIGIFLGIESFSGDSLRSVKKGFNKVDGYREAMRNLHDAGISVDAGIIFGFDHDDPSVFDATLEAARRLHLDCVNFNMLTPFPGTPLFDRMVAEGRLLTRDWSRYDPIRDIVFRPGRMSRTQLFEGYQRAVRTFYRRRSILERLWHTPRPAKLLQWFLNWHFRKVGRIFAREAPAFDEGRDLAREASTGVATAAAGLEGSSPASTDNR